MVTAPAYFKARTVPEQLEDALRGADMRWIDYSLHPFEALEEMERRGSIIRPAIDVTLGRRDLWHTVIKSIDDAVDEVVILPDGIFPNVEKHRLSKKHNVTHVKRYKSFSEKEKEVRDLRLGIRIAMSKIPLGEYRVGMDFRGATSSNLTVRVLTLDDLARAKIMDNLIFDSDIKIRAYDETAMADERGGRIHVDGIPSFSGNNGPYSVMLHHVPVVNGRESVKTSYDLYAVHNCGRSDWFTVKYGRKRFAFLDDERTADETVLDQHVILAMKKVVQWSERRMPLERRYQDPFPEPDKPFLAFYMKSFKQVLVQKQELQHGKPPKIEHTPLGDIRVFTEIVLQNYLAYLQEVAIKK